MKLLKRLFMISTLLMLAACGGGGGGTPFGGTPPPGAGDGGTGGGGGVAPTPTATDLVLVLSSATISNSGLESVSATATALDGNRNAVRGVPVVISVNSNGIVTPAGTVTDDSGRLSASIGLGADTSLRTLTVTAVSGTLTRTAQLLVQAGTGAAGQASLTLNVSGSTVTVNTPVTVTATLRNAQNQPLAGQVVALRATRNLVTLSATSVLTNADGVATATLTPGTGGLSGAEEIQASASVPAASGASLALTSAVAVAVTGASPTLAVALSPNSTALRASTSPVDFSATVRNAQGQPVSGVLVTFSSEEDLVEFSPATALSGADGRATIRVSPISAATQGAASLRAAATVDGQSVEGVINVQVFAESPSVTLALSSSNVSAASPATVSATVRTAAGTLANGVVVQFGSQFGLGRFDPATAVTVNGVATTILSPAAATSAGADILRASATVAGAQALGETTAQFVGGTPAGSPVLQLALSSTSVSAASPATVTATLSDARGEPVAAQVVTFTVTRNLGTTNIGTALTDSTGRAVVLLSPSSADAAGADEITASVNFAGAALQATRGFSVQATAVTLDAFTADDSPLSAYAQTSLRLTVGGASVTAPVNITVSSSCVTAGKASISPTTFTANGSSVTLQYRDNGCGAIQNQDQIQAVVTATGTTRALSLPITAPASNSIAFVQALPEQIFLRGSGFVESSTITFEVRDAANNPLPGRLVNFELLTGSGGVTLEDLPIGTPASQITQESNALGRVAVRINSGTLPTPVRVRATLVGTAISTVSSNLSVAIGLPSQLNFSLSQGTKNIEGYDIDGTPNTYQIIAADRNGNPVPAGTSINFVAEGGQVEAVRQTQIVNGIARTTAQFVSSEPRPADGRVTVTVYALGEESFIDLNGNNAYDPPGSLNLPVGPVRDAGEPFQDLGNIFKDRRFNGVFNPDVDEFIPLNISNSNACVAPGSPLLLLDASIPSVRKQSPTDPDSFNTCSGTWSGAGQVYVRRAVETVLSTSAARPLWGNTSGLSASCENNEVTLQVGPEFNQTATFVAAGGNTWYGGGGGLLSFIVADANPGDPRISQRPRLNPMAAGSTVSASTQTPGLSVGVGGGSPVPSTTEATTAAVTYTFTDPAVNEGVIFVTFRSPSGTGTTIAVPVVRGTAPSTCPIN
jgi:5-hydroxyisourate hydrolase-like protein (transthyretin family)